MKTPLLLLSLSLTLSATLMIASNVEVRRAVWPTAVIFGTLIGTAIVLGFLTLIRDIASETHDAEAESASEHAEQPTVTPLSH